MTKKTNKNDVSDKQVFTTGEAAKICNVSQQTIIRCFDSGRLQGFKVPGSRFRRIPRNELLRFMQENNMDLGRLDTGPLQVLVIGLSESVTDSVIRDHAVGHNIQIHHADDAWEAGFLSQECKPELIFINSSVPGIQKQKVQQVLGKVTGSEPLIVLVNNSYNNGMQLSSQNDESKEVIIKAVMQLVSA